MKFTFLSNGEITAIYEADSKDALKDRFTPDALKDLVQLPDAAVEGQLYDGTNLTNKKKPFEERTAEQIKNDEDWAACKTVDEKWAFAKASTMGGMTSIEEKFKDDATGLEAEKKEFYARYS